jgi:hypothetical protein
MIDDWSTAVKQRRVPQQHLVDTAHPQTDVVNNRGNSKL